MQLLSVQNLSKNYDKFRLKDVSFSLDAGYIMGFIGPNGAGKTSTLKAMMGLVKKDGGRVFVMGRDFGEHEMELKQHIGFSLGGVDYYAKIPLRRITSVVRRFYRDWDDEAYRKYIKRFELDEDKRPTELSGGMRVKYALALALSHHARLLLLDEPTSGLDPVARDNLLELFQELIEDGERSILFSTHITSDLEKCADYITYIENGRIVESRARDELLTAYRLVRGTPEQYSAVSPRLISAKKHAFGFTGLMRTEDVRPEDGLAAEAPALEDIMIYHVRKENGNEESAL